MKATAVAPANIAFIKYWGKRSEPLRIPLNDSISMNISGATTTTTVEFDSAFPEDIIAFIDEPLAVHERQRIIEQLNRIRRKAHTNLFARVVTRNSFPKGTGIASSASGFAALTLAAAKAIGLTMIEKELTILARIGSGSACRSIPDGFSWWHTGKKSSDSYAESLYPSTWWGIRDVLCIVSDQQKKVSSTAGMEQIRTSPLWKERIREIPEKIVLCADAIREKSIQKLGPLIEEDAISMHCVMMTQHPPLFYWNNATLRVIDTVYTLRSKGVPAYFTIDAGPNVHVICTSNAEKEVCDILKQTIGVQSVLVNSPSEGAHYISNHLF